MSHTFFRLPMFGFSLLGFLMICTILAVAVWLVFRSGETGTNKVGGLAGCFIALALVFMTGVGALGCVAISVLNIPDEIVRRGPFRKLEAHFDDHWEGWDKGSEKPQAEERASVNGSLRLRIEMRGGGDPAEISRWLRDHTDVNYTISTSTEDGPDGPATWVEIAFPVSKKELRRIRDDLKRDLPFLRIPANVRIEMKGEDD